MEDVLKGEFEQVLLTKPVFKGVDWDYTLEYKELTKPLSIGEEVWVLSCFKDSLVYDKATYFGKCPNHEDFVLVYINGFDDYLCGAPKRIDVVRTVSRKKPSIYLTPEQTKLVAEVMLTRDNDDDVMFEVK